MSSRSTFPAPALSAKGGAAIGPGGGGGTLSNDALYAPLSAYADPSTSTAGAPPGKRKGGHSLSLQTSSSLRESALLAFLTSTAQSLKTAHPQECCIYRSIGGSISQHGMGDGDRAGGGIRNVLEGKLSNRSLVLVGGGVHTYPSASTALGRSGEDVGLVGMGVQTAAGGKRARRRAGGNGMFGCISNKKRKKLLKQVREEQSKNRSGEAALSKSGNASSEDVQRKMSDIIATLHEMWTEYMQQLLKATDSPPSDADSASSSPEVRRKMAHALATAEHVGMPATIVECPSRRHLVHARCVVVLETKETWKVAMLARKRRKRANGEVAKGGGGTNETKVKAGNETADEKMPPSWKIVLVPKRGTVLDITLPPVGADTKNTSVTVRLET